MLKLNVLYNAVYLSRSIMPNKYPKIEFEIESKVRHSLLYIPLPFERQIQTSLKTWLCGQRLVWIMLLCCQYIEQIKCFLFWLILSCPTRSLSSLKSLSQCEQLYGWKGCVYMDGPEGKVFALEWWHPALANSKALKNTFLQLVEQITLYTKTSKSTQDQFCSGTD